jgi:hypothetical protein
MAGVGSHCGCGVRWRVWGPMVGEGSDGGRARYLLRHVGAPSVSLSDVVQVAKGPLLDYMREEAHLRGEARGR